MREHKHAKITAGVLFIGGIIFSYFAFGKLDYFPVFTLIIVFSLAGFLAGQEHVYEKYDNLHYSALEHDAKKRREKDKQISDKVAADIEEYEKNNPEIK